MFGRNASVVRQAADKYGVRTQPATKDNTMFTPPSTRAASAYKSVGIETSVSAADPHQLINLLFESLLQSLGLAKAALERGDIGGKGKAIGRAVRLIDEGLKASLNEEQGGDLAANLRSVYDYCVIRLTMANLKNDRSKIEEVENLIVPLAQSWKQIRAQALKGA
jgi:flagellar protein FliS